MVNGPVRIVEQSGVEPYFLSQCDVLQLDSVSIG